MPHSTASGTVDVIVQYKSFAGVQTRHGRLGRVHRHFRSIPATHMTVPVSMLESLAANPQVAYISPNRTTTFSGHHHADREGQSALEFRLGRHRRGRRGDR